MSSDRPPPRKRFLGTTARRVVIAILVTALIPLVSAVFIARTIIARVSATAFQPEFGHHLDQALGVYADLARVIKQEMRAQAEAISASEPLRAAARSQSRATLDVELARAFASHPSLVELRVETCPGGLVGRRAREAPVDHATERVLHVRRPLADGGEPGDCLADRPDEPLALIATFSAPRARLDELESVQAFAQAYHQIERGHREEYLDQTYANVFAALLAGTLLLAVAAGVLVARPVTRRIALLAAATRPVAEGDLSVRVGLEGDDEVADLGRAFDRMLEELSRSRARVEFLRRMSEWQKMARRLAHEIKNPLTPIQLAVEECHRRYRGDDAEYKRIVQTTLEVVEEEVGSLRRLVSEFSSFARLPQAELRGGDLGDFLREQAAHLTQEGGEPDDQALFAGVEVTFDIPSGPMPAAMDQEMLHRVLTNVIRNSAQAIRDDRAKKGPTRGHVRVTARVERDQYAVEIDDDGPGIPPDIEQALFDPYVTTKPDGTGLGLSIVKKIIVDHGGSIEAGRGPLGGARFKIVLPREGSIEARAAAERGELGPESRRAAGTT